MGLVTSEQLKAAAIKGQNNDAAVAAAATAAIEELTETVEGIQTMTASYSSETLSLTST